MKEISSNSDNKEWFKSNRDNILKTIGMLQTVSYFANEGIIPKDRVADMWAKSFIEQWFYLGEYIESFRKEIGEPPSAEKGAYYARSFEEFAKYCRRYIDNKFPTDWAYLDKPQANKIDSTVNHQNDIGVQSVSQGLSPSVPSLPLDCGGRIAEQPRSRNDSE